MNSVAAEWQATVLWSIEGPLFGCLTISPPARLCPGWLFSVASTPRRSSQLFEHWNGVVPAQTCVGNALAKGQLVARCGRLRTLDEKALDHHTEDRTAAIGNSFCNGRSYFDLLLMLLAAVGVAAINHHAGAQPRRQKRFAGRLNAGGVVIGTHGTTA